MTDLNRLISPDFFKDVNGLVDENAIPLNACVVVEFIDGEGNHQLATGFSEDMTYCTKEGMCRSLLRDAIMIPVEAERREASRRLDELDDE